MPRIHVLLLAVVYLSLAEAHICLLTPTQRGGFTTDINKKASTDCIKLHGPCGGMTPDNPPKQAISAGTNFTVVWQKNLDHYNKIRPGYFSVRVGQTQDSLTEVARVADDWRPSLSLFTQVITAPQNAGAYVVQIQYLTNNSQAPPAFFQCSDFLVFPPIRRGFYNHQARRHNGNL